MFLFWPRFELIVHVLTQSVLLSPKAKQKYCFLSKYTQKGQCKIHNELGLCQNIKYIVGEALSTTDQSVLHRNVSWNFSVTGVLQWEKRHTLK